EPGKGNNGGPQEIARLADRVRSPGTASAMSWGGLERGEQPLAEHRPAPAVQQRAIAPPIRELLEIPSRCQHLRDEGELACRRLADAAQLSPQCGLHGILPGAARKWRRRLWYLRTRDALEQLGAAPFHEARRHL